MSYVWEPRLTKKGHVHCHMIKLQIYEYFHFVDVRQHDLTPKKGIPWKRREHILLYINEKLRENPLTNLRMNKLITVLNHYVNI